MIAVTFYIPGENNSNGQLGDGTNTASNIPVPISFSSSGLVSFYIAISAGQTHSLAIKNDNTLWSTGYNNQGQLGLGNLINTNVLTQVGTANNWIAISAGHTHFTCDRYKIAIFGLQEEV